MKKMSAFKIFLKTLLFLVGLLLTLWIFMPWKQVGEAVLLSVSRRLPTSASLAYSTVGKAGGGFVINNLEVKNLMGMLDASFNTLTIVPDAAASVMGLAPTCRVAFTGAVIGDIAVTPLMKIPGVALGNGRVVISVNKQGIFLENLRSDGELSANGSLLADPSEMRIVWADIALDVKSKEFEEKMSLLESVLPLHQEGPGRWFLRRSLGSEK